MINLKELNSHNYLTTPEIDSNLGILLSRINLIRAAWGKPMIVTSGLRSEADQLHLINIGKSIATRSHHLVGAAVDIADKDGSLQKWLEADATILETAQLWCESGTSGWVHFQICAPKSGKRWFYP